jgi:hypothetical protein
MNRKNILILLLFCINCLALSCENPFSTREPEPPEENSQSRFIDASLPDDVLTNLEYAFADRNVENYIRSLVDSTRSQLRFVFLPDQGVANNNPGVFVNWAVEDERRYLLELMQAIPPDSALTLLFLNKQAQSETIDDVIYIGDYIIVARHTLQDEEIPVTFRGQARFGMAKNQTGTWEIYRWEDFSNRTDPSWSELKAALR